MRSFALLIVFGFALAPLALANHGGPGGWAAVQAQMAGVPCTVAAVGETTSANLKKLAQIALPGGDHGEVDIRGHLALVARFDPAEGFEVVDLSNPLAPTLLGRTSGVASGKDVKFTPDGLSAVVGRTTGIDIIDVRNPAAPVKVGQWNFPSFGVSQNAHMLYAKEIGGIQWVFVAPNSNSGVFILKLQGPPEARTLTKVAQTLPVEGGPLGPHDMWVTFDVDAGKWLLYVADGFHGWLVHDVSDPAAPQLVGGFVHASSGYTHTIQAAKINGRRLVATIEEVGVNLLKVYDASNLLAPVLLGVWQAHPQGPVDPQHDLNIVAGKLYMAHYRQGFYIFDLAALGPLPVAGTLDLKPVAHYAATGGNGLNFNDFWDVVVADGLLYANDIENGLHVVGYGCNTPGDATLTSTG